MLDEQRPNYRLIYDGQIGEPFPVIGNLDFYAPCSITARGIAIGTIMDWNTERSSAELFPSFGLIRLLALDDSGRPIDEKCLFKKIK